MHSGNLNETAIFPSQDTSVVFNLFSYFNNNLSENGVIPTWNFHALYGQRFEYWLTQFSPVMILTSYLGRILGANDNYNLYLFSIGIEQIIFIYGAYLLCKKLELNNKIIFLTFVHLYLHGFGLLRYQSISEQFIPIHSFYFLDLNFLREAN